MHSQANSQYASDLWYALVHVKEVITARQCLIGFCCGFCSCLVSDEIQFTQNGDPPAVHCLVQIDGFAEELDSLNDDFREVLGDWEGVRREEVEVAGLGTMEDLQQLREETQEVEDTVRDTTRRMKVTVGYEL